MPKPHELLEVANRQTQPRHHRREFRTIKTALAKMQRVEEREGAMIRPHLDVTMHMGFISKVYPPMQWNETTSQRKMLTDIREWLHNHHPSWKRAMVHLRHFNGEKSYNDTFSLERGQNL